MGGNVIDVVMGRGGGNVWERILFLGGMTNRAHTVLEGTIPAEDGTRIWYRMEGTGPTLICQNGVGVTTTFWRDAAARFAQRGYRTILWDYRGHGRSDDPADPASVTLETCVQDLRTVMDALEVESACLLGHSMGSQLGWEFYRAHPSRVAGLVPTLGTYRDAIASFYDLPHVAPRVFSAASYVVERFPRLAKRVAAIPAARPALSELVMRRLSIVHPTLSPRDWVPAYLEHMARLDPRVFFSLAKAIRDHDASELLPTIQVPVLVVAGEKDFFCPPRVAQEMADKIPGAELLIIPGGSHAAIIEQPHLFDLRLARFLETRVFPGGSPSAEGADA